MAQLSADDVALLSKDGFANLSTTVAPGVTAKKTVEVTTKQIANAAKNTAVNVAKGNSTKLGENLVKAGFTRPANSAAHHIVQGGGKQPFVSETREILKKAGVGIDDSTNGVWMANTREAVTKSFPYHRTIHTNVYRKAVFNRLKDLPINQVANELSVIRTEILKGIFPF